MRKGTGQGHPDGAVEAPRLEPRRSARPVTWRSLVVRVLASGALRGRARAIRGS